MSSQYNKSVPGSINVDDEEYSYFVSSAGTPPFKGSKHTKYFAIFASIPQI
jgi:hypothetical protein